MPGLVTQVVPLRGVDSAYASLWAKTAVVDGAPQIGLLLTHLMDSVHVAGALWDQWIPEHTQKLLISELGTQARVYLACAAGVHDIGKASPVFQCKATEDLYPGPQRAAGLVSPSRPRAQALSRRHPHGEVGRVVLEGLWDLPGQVDGAPRRGASAMEALAAAAAAHHGSQDAGYAIPLVERGDVLGGAGWDEIRAGLVHEVFAAAGASKTLSDQWRATELSIQAQVVIAGFVVLCDWVASTLDYFLLHDPNDQPRRSDSNLTGTLDLTPPIVFDPPRRAQEYFPSRFGFPPRPAQQQVFEHVTALIGDTGDTGEPWRATMTLIEAETGSGKTEAGLAVAELLGAASGCSGVLWTLPTKATADGAYLRFAAWVDAVAGPESASLRLVHGDAAFNSEWSGLLGAATRTSSVFDESGDDCAGGSSADQGCGGYAAAWLSGRHRGVFAPFVVGTVDTALRAGLNTKHAAVRQLGLAGKVLLIDEVHASDEHMLVYLERVLGWAGAYGLPVVALTATAPSSLRTRLLAAYAAGAQNIPAKRARRLVGSQLSELRAVGVIQPGQTVMSWRQGQVAADTLTSSQRTAVVARPAGVSEPADLAELAVSLMAGGDAADEGAGAGTSAGVVAVVCNTVRRAQEVFEQVSAKAPGDTALLLLHSRMTVADRAAATRELLALVGPDGVRPQRLIVVATQVIEQSLDLDFDALVSDVCPLDALIQRAGRVHRHLHNWANRPAQLVEPVVWVCGYSGAGAALDVAGTLADRIYGRWPVTVTAEVLERAGAAGVELGAQSAGLLELADGRWDESDPAWTEYLGQVHARWVTDNAVIAGAAADGTVAGHRELQGRGVSAFPRPGGVHKDWSVSVRRDGLPERDIHLFVVDDDGTVRLPSWMEGSDVDLRTVTGGRPAKTVAGVKVRRRGGGKRWDGGMDMTQLRGLIRSGWLDREAVVIVCSETDGLLEGTLWVDGTEHQVLYDRVRGLL